MSFPYSYYSCSCTDTSSEGSKVGAAASSDRNDEDREEKTFDPRSPRSNFSLHLLDELMWCEDCHDLKCQRCAISEIVCWYCPSCLFETPSGVVKSEGNRCNRNCFNCPTCTAPMAVNALDRENSGVTGPYILACDYCNWTTLDIGIQFEKPTGIYHQLLEYRNIGSKSWKANVATKEPQDGPGNQDPDARFAALKSFHHSQISKASSSNPLSSPTGDFNYNSPSSLARIMNLYTGLGSYNKKSPGKPSSMRESADLSEGLQVLFPPPDQATIQKLRTLGWAGTTNLAQRVEQIHPHRFLDQLLPVPTILTTKRSRRCRACRHILVKPEAKVQATRYRIKLVAAQYAHSLTLKPLQSSSTIPLDLKTLPSSKPLQFLLVVKNPTFDDVKVTLATPTQTLGRWPSKVTILCPQFDIGANADAWDAALRDPEGKRTSKIAPRPKEASGGEGKVAEAGKIWDQGRNWTTVVLEVVCASIPLQVEVEEDEDILEIPVFVRVESEVYAGEKEGKGEKVGEKERKETSYWCVLGVGRIARSVT